MPGRPFGFKGGFRESGRRGTPSAGQSSSEDKSSPGGDRTEDSDGMCNKH
jgi:hypothetical protein